MIINIKVEEIKQLQVDEVIIYDVHYMLSAFSGNYSGSRIVSFSNMPTTDDIEENNPFKINTKGIPKKALDEDGNVSYMTIVKEKQIIKTDDKKYIYNYNYSDKEFLPKYYSVIEN